ncbi:hypothetical protein V2J09_014013 [Rumex salicifolius]
MMLRSEAGKKSRNVLDKGKLMINDVDALNKGLYSEKNHTRSSASSSRAIGRGKSIGRADRSDLIPKSKQRGVGGGDFEGSAKDKKSFWNWKPLKALSNARSRKFNFCFTLQVHTIKDLPSAFNGRSLVVHWKWTDGGLVSAPAKVSQGVAQFEEQLSHTCSVHCSRSGFHHSVKYEAKHLWLFVSLDGQPGLDFGRHKVDLTKLLPETFEELEGEKSSGKWTTSYKLLGKAAGATVNVSFGYVLFGDTLFLPPNNKNVLERLNSKQKNPNSCSIDDGESRIPRSESLPQTPYDKVLHEVLPATGIDLSDSLTKLDIMLQNERLDPAFGDDPALDVPVDQSEPAQCSYSCTDPSKQVVICENADLSSAEKPLGSSIEEKAPNNDYAAATGDSKLENRLNCTFYPNIEASLEGETVSYLKNSPDNIQESIIYDDKSVEKDACTTDSILKELEFALNDVVDLEKEAQDTPEAKSELGYLQNYVDGNLNSVDMSLNLEDLESAESEFLSLLGIEDAPLDVISEGEPESPRERLLREFERETEFSGYSLFGCSFSEEEEEYKYDAPRVREWESLSEDSDLPSTVELGEEHYIASQLGISNACTVPRFKNCADDFELASASQMIEDLECASEAPGWRPRAKVLEDLETEELMQVMGLNEKTFESSPSDCTAAFEISSELTDQYPHTLPALGEGLGPFVQTKNGGFLRSMNPALFTNSMSGGRLIMQVSSPVVVPADMGSEVMEMLENLASLGLERLSAQANKLMPLEDITGKTMQQIAWEAAPQLETNDRHDLLQHESESAPAASGGHKKSKRRSSRLKSHASSSLRSMNCELDSEYVNLEDLAPLAMDKIEAVSMEGLKIQSGMSEEEEPSSIKPKSLGVEGAVGLQLLDVRDDSAAVDGLMGLSLTLNEWMRMDSGEIDEDEMNKERTSKILAAHHASSSKGGPTGRRGLFGNNFTVALMVQLRDPLRDYEPVGTPMLALIQVERVFVPPKPKVYTTLSERKKNDDDDDNDTDEVPETVHKHEDEKVPEDLIPQYKVADVHVAGLKTTQPGKNRLWGSASQKQSGSRWLLANGMGKPNKQPFLKTKAAAKSSSQATTVAQSGDTLWSISTKIHGTGAKWKNLSSLNPHLRNPNLIIPTGTVIRIR